MGRVFGLIPAAGKSRRMGRPKLALPLGGATILEHVISVLKEAGIAEVLVVVGPHGRDLIPLAEAAGARVLSLSEETLDMRTTVQHGLDWLERTFQPGSDDAWLLLPADHPTLESAVVSRLLEARAQAPTYSIFIPTHEGGRGHPSLIAWREVPRLRAFPLGSGLNAFFREVSQAVCEIPVPWPEVLADLDTPEDYERLQGRWHEDA